MTCIVRPRKNHATSTLHNTLHNIYCAPQRACLSSFEANHQLDKTWRVIDRFLRGQYPDVVL